jgi:hypothetical protein
MRPTNDVRALAGSVEEKRATSGVLVASTWADHPDVLHSRSPKANCAALPQTIASRQMALLLA